MISHGFTIAGIVSMLFGSGIFVSISGYIVGRIKANDRHTDAISNGVQALLRDRLYHMYKHYVDKGFAPIYAKENFENLYAQYHALGANGVMDSYREKFMEMPSEEVKK